MRMWMVDPRIMCRKHLLGEHVEHHMFAGTLAKGISVSGYVRDNLMEPLSLLTRHALLAREMEARGYNHKSPLTYVKIEHLSPEEAFTAVDSSSALRELLRRCPECRARYNQLHGGKDD